MSKYFLLILSFQLKIRFLDEDEEKPIIKTARKRKLPSSSNSKENKKGVKVKKDKTTTPKKVKENKEKRAKKEKKIKEPKAKKAKVDKSNPNWRLKPNLNISVYQKVGIRGYI